MLGAAILFFRHAVMELVGQKQMFLSVFQHTLSFTNYYDEIGHKRHLISSYLHASD
jgi:hypothetical protein